MKLLFTVSISFFAFFPFCRGQSGYLDPDFGNNGTLASDWGMGPGTGATAKAVTLQPDGKIIVLGTHTADSFNDSDPILVRLLPTLGIDASNFSAASPGVLIYPNLIGEAVVQLLKC